MKQLRRLTISAGMMLGLLSFCFFGDCGAEAQHVITDMLGNQIQVPEPLQRVALFGGPTGQIAYLLGARDKVCAVSRAMKASDLLDMLDPTMADVAAPRGTAGHIQLETLIMADPQLVVAGELDGSIVAKKTGLPVAYLKSDMGGGRDMLKKEIRFYADVFQAGERGERYIAYLERTIAMVQSRVAGIPEAQRRVVFHGYGPSHLVTLGGDTFMKERIETAGCINATDRIGTGGKREGLHSGLDEVSMEQVLMWNPDLVIIDTDTPRSLFDDPRWQAVDAVQQRRVFVQPIGIFIWDRPTAEAAVLHPLWLAKIAYPDRFRDVDMVVQVIDFYSWIMDFSLSKEQAEKILSGGFKVRFGPGRH